MTKYFIAICIFPIIWSVYCVFYYGWLTATPLEEGYLEIYQKSAIYWMGVTLLFGCLIVGATIRIIILYKSKLKAE